jgi:predicted polyphosphate/ATP-dependent NAD kinase
VETQINHSNIPSSEFRNVLTLYNTTKRDTQDALKYMMKHNVAIIVFFGGDGTARDVAEIVQLHTPCLGIPGGVKVFSSVFAASPSKGAELIVQFLHGSAPIVESEVLDIDEEAFRRNQIEVKLFGYLKTPHAPLLLQGMKQATPFSDDEYENQVAIARTIIEDMDSTSYYIFGPGTTVRAIFDLMKLEKTLLGFDIVKNGQLIASDVNESEIMQIVKKGTIKLVISPIGRQGFVFGRGNLQITGKIISEISKDNIHVICSRSKLSTLPEGYIRTDIRDPEMDKKLRGFYRVLIDYHEYKMIKMI